MAGQTFNHTSFHAKEEKKADKPKQVDSWQVVGWLVSALLVFLLGKAGLFLTLHQLFNPNRW